MNAVTPTVRRRCVLGSSGLARVLAVCLTLAGGLGAAGCVAPSNGGPPLGAPSPSGQPPRARFHLGFAMCKDEPAAPTATHAEVAPPPTAEPAAPVPPADTCSAPSSSAQQGQL